jgi:hypothetical protein
MARVPEIATPARVAKIKAYGAEARMGGAPYAETQEACDADVAGERRPYRPEPRERVVGVLVCGAHADLTPFARHEGGRGDEIS